MRISDSDRCPVCAMKAAGRKLASAIALRSGETFYFCGTGCMIKSWLHPEIFLGHDKKQLARAVTTDYFSGKHIDALTARWVAGSNVVGPMGKAIVPLADEAAVKDFRRRHGGEHVFSLGELTDAKWKQLTGKQATMRPRK
jgi:nitrous oxide reductase accessory protein NosL